MRIAREWNWSFRQIEDMTLVQFFMLRLQTGDGKVNIVRVAIRDLRVRLASRRFNVIEIFPADRFDELAVDKVADLERLGAHGSSKG